MCVKQLRTTDLNIWEVSLKEELEIHLVKFGKDERSETVTLYLKWKQGKSHEHSLWDIRQSLAWHSRIPIEDCLIMVILSL